MKKIIGVDIASGKDITVTARFKNNKLISHELLNTQNSSFKQVVSLDLSKIEESLTALISNSSSKK
jgi:hypothetical protein